MMKPSPRALRSASISVNIATPLGLGRDRLAAATGRRSEQPVGLLDEGQMLQLLTPLRRQM